MTTDQLLVFTRYPTVGQAKTRLIPALGAVGAADLHRQLTAMTMAQVQELQQNQSLLVTIYFADDQQHQGTVAMVNWLGAQWQYQPQVPGDLGVRMAQAFVDAWQTGMKRVVIIGTDCPSLTAAIIQSAFEQLATHDVVLGPAIDGGYYLLGLRSPVPELFVDIPWSTDEVMSKTLAIVQDLNLSSALLPPLADIDRPADLVAWQQSPTTLPGSDETISVIIPALNEAQTIQQTIASAQASDESVEIIVVDGGSSDDTVAIARALGAKVITTTPGRSQQMNVGAAAATGHILLFLHADTLLPERFDQIIRATFQQQSKKKIIAGAFELRINGTATGLRLVEWGVKWRSHFLKMPYGDQAIFLRTETFQQVGGFPDMPLMEDFELISRLQRFGTIKIAPAAVVTSDRRWRKKGILQTTIINQLIVAAYLSGVTPERLAQWYRGRKKSAEA